MSDDAIAWAPAQDTGSPRIKSLLIALAPFVQADGTVWAKIDVLSLKMDCADRTVQRSIKAALAANWLENTGRLHLYEGKLYPLYSVPLERGPANMRARLEIEKARSSGDRMSPQAGLGCQIVTPTGDRLSPLRVTECHPTNLRESKKEEGECERAGASADLGGAEVEAAFNRVWPVWASAVKDGVARPMDLAAWIAACEAMGDPAELERCALRYLAKSPAVKRGAGKSMVKWLAQEGWLAWGEEGSATLAAASPARPAFDAPADVVALLKGNRQRDWIAYLGRAVWDDAERAIVCGATAADALRREPDIAAGLAAIGVKIIVRRPA